MTPPAGSEFRICSCSFLYSPEAKEDTSTWRKPATPSAKCPFWLVARRTQRRTTNGTGPHSFTASSVLHKESPASLWKLANARMCEVAVFTALLPTSRGHTIAMKQARRGKVHPEEGTTPTHATNKPRVSGSLGGGGWTHGEEKLLLRWAVIPLGTESSWTPERRALEAHGTGRG